MHWLLKLDHCAGKDVNLALSLARKGEAFFMPGAER